MPKPKIVFIAHPISGQTPAEEEKNLKNVAALCRTISSNGNVIPFFPRLLWKECFGNSSTGKDAGLQLTLEAFHRGFIDEVWLYGNHISNGMEGEITIAQSLAIPVIPKSQATKLQLMLVQ
jgi:hypothetical protein